MVEGLPTSRVYFLKMSPFPCKALQKRRVVLLISDIRQRLRGYLVDLARHQVVWIYETIWNTGKIPYMITTANKVMNDDTQHVRNLSILYLLKKIIRPEA